FGATAALASVLLMSIGQDALSLRRGSWPIRDGHNTSQPSGSLETCIGRMLRLNRRARSTDCTINFCRTAIRMANGILHRSIEELKSISETPSRMVYEGI